MLKQEIVAKIAQEIGIVPPRMSTGSTEPRELFSLIDDSLGLRIVEDFSGKHGRSPTKQELARLIVNSAGLSWSPTSESRGGTVTREGLMQVLHAVHFFTGQLADEEP